MAVGNEKVKMQSAELRKGGIRKAEGGRNSAVAALHPPVYSPGANGRTAYRLPPTAYQRRGVLLLVVLSMLILFVMIAVTYVLVSSRQLSIGRNQFKNAQTNGIGVDPPQSLVDDAMMEVLRGTTNPRSVLGGSMSLLEHYYGGPAGQPVLYGQVSTITPYVNGQILQIAAVNKPFASPPALTNINDTPSVIEGYYEGCLLTMTTGQAVGLSSRIVRHMIPASGPSSGQILIRVLPFKGPRGVVVPSAGDVFIINGRPFAGTGNGWNPATGILDAKDSNSREFALLPNPVFYSPTGDYKADSSNPNWKFAVPYGGWGGANIDYNIPDYQNMYMAWISPTPNSSVPVTVLPSYHRPDLINYWMKTREHITTWDTTNVALLRQICLRPNPVDHPNFSGSNPNMDGVSNFTTNIVWQTSTSPTPPWDVDNDGDGVPDSVWIDLGYPVQSTADGRLYKPLFAILCLDLDGRLNVNTAGTTEQIAASHTATPAGPYAGGNASPALPRGLGTGPAEIDVTAMVGLPPAGSSVSKTGFDKTDFTAMISRKSGVTFDGRYGDASSGTPQAGIPGTFDKLGLIKHFQYPDDTFNMTSVPFSLSAYGSPSDLWGRMTVALDFRGQPYYYKPNLTNTTYATPNMWQGEMLNSPYDLNLSRDLGSAGVAYQANTADNPFTVYELERLLRRQDIDSQELPQRLWQLSGIASKNNTPQVQLQLPRELTTDSWDPPVPSTTYPPKARQGVAALAPAERYSAHHITEMVTGLMLSNTNNPTGSMTNATVNAAIRDLLPEDLIAGLRMNINRPFGIGRDADGNGIVDEPTGSELTGTANHGAWWTMGNLYSSLGQAYSNYKTAFLNLTNGMNVTGPKANDKNRRRVNANEELMSRQLMARYLYVLARLFIDDKFLVSPNNKWFQNDPFDPSIQGDQAKMYKASVRRIAQWAINVVDFMDADSIMTPFEYDLFPFSTVDLITMQPKDPANPGRTWCVDGIIDDGSGNISADDTKSWRGLVWGCERPELVDHGNFRVPRPADGRYGQGKGRYRSAGRPMPNQQVTDSDES